MKRAHFLLAIASMLVFGNAAASELTYLSCDVPGKDGGQDRHFDFTLDETNGTVSFYVKEANAINVEKAVFGPETITWTTNSEYFSIIRTISRVDLSFTEESDIAGIKDKDVGICAINTPKARKF